MGSRTRMLGPLFYVCGVPALSSLQYLLQEVYMRTIITVLALFLSVSFAQAKILKQGERTGFYGVFCKTLKAADPIAIALSQGKEKAAILLYNREPHCTIGMVPVEVLHLAKKHGSYSIVRVQDPNGTHHFIITSMKYELAGLAL